MVNNLLTIEYILFKKLKEFILFKYNPILFFQWGLALEQENTIEQVIPMLL